MDFSVLRLYSTTNRQGDYLLVSQCTSVKKCNKARNLLEVKIGKINELLT